MKEAAVRRADYELHFVPAILGPLMQQRKSSAAEGVETSLPRIDSCALSPRDY